MPSPKPPRLVFAFSGTRSEFEAFLEALDVYALTIDDEETEWQITASMSRHPAGKGLPSEADLFCRRCIGWCSCGVGR